MPLKTVNITELRKLLSQVEKALKSGHTVHATYRGVVRLVLTLPTTTHSRITAEDTKDAALSHDVLEKPPYDPYNDPLMVEDIEFTRQKSKQPPVEQSDEEMDREVSRLTGIQFGKNNA